jgi:CBS domain-containing protein
MIQVESILKAKGRETVTIKPGATIADAVALLCRRRIGAVVVSSDGKAVLGILSERDIVHALAEHGARLLERKVAGFMTKRVVTCTPADSVAAMMAEMTTRRIRHIPVLEHGQLAGVVSIGDVVKNRLDDVEWEANNLRQFIAGAA